MLQQGTDAGTDKGEAVIIERLIEAAYNKILLRPVDPGGMSYWRNVLVQNSDKAEDFIEFLLSSAEFANCARRFLHHYVAPETLKLINDNSQNGEVTLLLSEMVGRSVRHKVVVDVGAYGRSGSNSYDLMRHFGWRGLLIEPNPYLIPKIETEFAGLDYKLVNAAAASYSGSATLHLGVHDEISSIHRSATEHWGPVHETCTVITERLPAILETNNVPREFGLLSIDAEGEGTNLFEDVFTSGYRPTWVILEVFEGLKIASLDELALSAELKAGYRIVARTFANVILEYVETKK